ncbi:hypothetical protein NLG97_g6629 [Lecanicillium saksenae]|uniref:Uncharacterized protein n=1 Tax=Lecanicillium saksenae TaxID=468837 RepID=A0ACC1QPN6_9HYPO|nr:hypothetical protein NLG97_g6629 [Lecanicillium saksenae]
MPSTQDSKISCTCSADSRRSSASEASASTSSTSSTKPTIELSPEMTPSAFISKAPVHPLPAYAREFPKPTGEIDIEEALNRKPGRWSFHGAIQASIKKQNRPFSDEFNQEATRTEAYNAAKKALLESAAQLGAAGSKQ